MTKKSSYLLKLSASVLTVITLLSLFSCSDTKKRRDLEDFSDTLRTDYQSCITYSAKSGENEISGNAEIQHSVASTSLSILSPEPYSGLSIEYDVKGLPSSVAVHFSGMDTHLPAEAISNISSVAVIFADDFAQSLSKLSAEGLTEYEIPGSDGKKGYKADIKHQNADIAVYFSADTCIPLFLEYRSDSINADITFDSFIKQSDNGEE